MNMMLLIACTRLVSGFFISFSISPFEFTNALFNGLISKPKRLKDEVNAFTQRKKKSNYGCQVTKRKKLSFVNRIQVKSMRLEVR